MNRIEKSMKEKEEQTKREIELYRQQTENIIKQIKEKSKEKLEKLDEQNKKELEDLERHYQLRVNQNAQIINRLLLGYQNEVRNDYRVFQGF